MKNINGNNGILRDIKNNPNIDFVAYVVTQWHVHSLEASVKKIESLIGRKLNGIVVIKSHPKTGYAVGPESFSSSYQNIYFFENDEGMFDILKSEILGLFYYISLKSDEKERFYIFRPTGFRYPIVASIDNVIGKNRSVSVVEIDEGTATYLNNKEDLLTETINEQSSVKGKIKAYIKYFEGKLFSAQKMKIKGRYLNTCLFLKNENGECIDNGDMALYYSESISNFANMKEYVFECNEKYVIINPEMSSLIFISGEDFHDEMIKKTINIFRNRGYQIYIKPHPRVKDIKKYEEFGAHLISNCEMSQEAILSKTINRPDYIVGFMSTALVTASALFDVRAISLSQIVIDQNEFIPHSNDNAKKFIKIFNNQVICPTNFGEIEKLVN